MRRIMLAAVVIFTFLFCAGSVYADFGGFSGGSSSRSRTRHRSSSSKSSTPSKAWSEKTTSEKMQDVGMGGLCAAVLGWTPAYLLILRRRINKYKKAHPDFDEKELEAFAEGLYYRMQSEWRKKDISSLKENMTSEFFARMDAQLDTLRAQGRTDYTERITVSSSKLYNIKRKDETDYFIVNILANIVSYVMDDTTGRLVSGDMNNAINMEYYLTFIEQPGAVSLDKDKSRWLVCDMKGKRRKK